MSKRTYTRLITATETNQVRVRTYSELDVEATDEELRLEQDVLAPLAEAKKLYVFNMTQPWVQIKSAA